MCVAPISPFSDVPKQLVRTLTRRTSGARRRRLRGCVGVGVVVVLRVSVTACVRLESDTAANQMTRRVARVPAAVTLQPY
jgi:hypothetical protein